MEIEKSRFPIINIETVFSLRKINVTKEQENIIKNRQLISRTLNAVKNEEVSEQKISEMMKWLEKVAEFVPIVNNQTLEDLIKTMVILSVERAKFNELYDKPGLNLMKRVREGMIRYMVVLSELRAHQKEFLIHWFTDEYWIGELSRIFLNLKPEETMAKYKFESIKAREFLFLLILELATADDASKVDKPMVILYPNVDENNYIIIPTKAAAEEYEVQVNRILNSTVTFTEWINDTLAALKLPL